MVLGVNAVCAAPLLSSLELASISVYANDFAGSHHFQSINTGQSNSTKAKHCCGATLLCLRVALHIATVNT